MKISTIQYKEVVIAYKDGNDHRLINSIWERAPFKFKQYDDIRNGDLVQVFVMTIQVADEHIQKTIDQTLTQLLIREELADIKSKSEQGVF
jgi:hypothetical protein